MDFNQQTNQILATGTNLPLILTPAGSGAIQAQAADAGIGGGNARGANAVDWQTTRSAANQVASGSNAVLGGGNGNLANANNSMVGGGSGNTASGSAAAIAGGSANTASGSNSAVSGGASNVAAGQNATVAGGNTNTANGGGSWSPGGQHSTTRGVAGRGAWAATRISVQGDAQCGEHPLLRLTSDATPTRLTSDGNTPSAANTVNLPNFAAYSGTLTVVAKATGSTAAATWRVNISAVRGNGVATVALYEGGATALVPTASSGAGSAWRLDVAADTTNGGIALTGTGAAATTINWSARFANVEATTAS